MIGKLVEWLNKRREQRERDDNARFDKLFEANKKLSNAASTAEELQNDVHSRLVRQLVDALKTFDTTTGVLTDALFIAEQNGTIEATNPAVEYLFGYEAGELDGAKLNTLFVHPDGKPVERIAELWQLFDEGDAYAPRSLDDEAVTELLAVREDGTTFPCDVSVSRINRSDARTVLVVVVRDVSERIEIEAKFDAIGAEVAKVATSQNVEELKAALANISALVETAN